MSRRVTVAEPTPRLRTIAPRICLPEGPSRTLTAQDACGPEGSSIPMHEGRAPVHEGRAPVHEGRLQCKGREPVHEGRAPVQHDGSASVQGPGSSARGSASVQGPGASARGSGSSRRGRLCDRANEFAATSTRSPPARTVRHGTVPPSPAPSRARAGFSPSSAKRGQGVGGGGPPRAAVSPPSCTSRRLSSPATPPPRPPFRNRRGTSGGDEGRTARGEGPADGPRSIERKA